MRKIRKSKIGFSNGTGTREIVGPSEHRVGLILGGATPSIQYGPTNGFPNAAISLPAQSLPVWFGKEMIGELINEAWSVNSFTNNVTACWIEVMEYDESELVQPVSPSDLLQGLYPEIASGQNGKSLSLTLEETTRLQEAERLVIRSS